MDNAVAKDCESSPKRLSGRCVGYLFAGHEFGCKRITVSVMAARRIKCFNWKFGKEGKVTGIKTRPSRILVLGRVCASRMLVLGRGI
ncbi:hypothetical protein AKJ43_02625 [candidate division MSBL1 archaeon SCGC-AAA261D19]|uniref:Uncharacterized protein n=1 Tax=candidate division MSBL1 archaeon SCGC-AAA261D19 TaxID=1698273 RepID=A0A133V6G3_9EURY|nr:hypothetical protein AKJ43_02625 [candidate division MSBL1 archaeon SCGC-AAA261D19]